MISMDKKYQTRDGREVKIYEVHDQGPYPVHGAVLHGNGWSSSSWTSEGRYLLGFNNHSLDLIEVKEKGVVESWVNVYREGGVLYCHTRDEADGYAEEDRIACIHIRHEYEEGEGL